MLGVGDRGRGDNTSQYAHRGMFSNVCVCMCMCVYVYTLI